MSVDLCYVISHGFAARMVLHSDVLQHLTRRGMRTAIIMPGAQEPGVQALAARHQVQVIEPPAVQTRYSSKLERLRRYVFEDVRRNPALWAKHLRDVQGAENRRRFSAPAFLLMNRICQRIPPVRNALRTMEARLRADARTADLLREIQPSLLVATYPVSPLESTFLYEAKRQGIPTVGQLLSWDNITCKGYFSVVPDRFLAWGPIMAQELQAYYEVPEDHIHECGVAHFDAHLKVPSAKGIWAAVEKLGLDPEKPFLFFGMSSPYFAPREIDIVEWLAQRIREDLFGMDLQLIVRPHPLNVQGNMADLSWLPRLQALEGARVAVDYPSVQKSDLAWNLHEDDLPHLANLLAGCAVCLNSCSTLSIDAIIHDKPVVLTTFDAGHSLPWWQSVRRLVDYTHMNKLIDMGGVRVVTSFEELEASISAYLQDPSLDAAGREATRTAQCGPCDGGASERIAEALTSLVGRLELAEWPTMQQDGNVYG